MNHAILPIWPARVTEQELKNFASEVVGLSPRVGNW